MGIHRRLTPYQFQLNFSTLKRDDSSTSRIRLTLSGPMPGDSSPGYKATPDKSG
jgi:hypothetical protein